MLADGQLITVAIVNRAPRAKAPGLVVQERGKGAAATLLLAVAEATAKRSAPAYEKIAATLQALLKEGDVSAPALRTGIEGAHRALVAANGRAPGREPLAVGVSCALIRGPQLLLAQAGPGLAYWLDEGGLTVSAPDLGPAGPTSNALGLARKLHVHLHRRRLEPGATLLLATSPLARLVSRQELEKLLADELAPAAQRLYRQVRRLPNFAAILYRQGAP